MNRRHSRGSATQSGVEWKQQDLAVASGYWPLFRDIPAMRKLGETLFRLDFPRPAVPLKDYANSELRYSALARTRPAEAAELL